MHRVGYVDDYIYVDTDGEFVTLKPLNGATLYYTVAGASEKPMTQLEEPTFDSEQLKPGQKVVFIAVILIKMEEGEIYI